MRKFVAVCDLGGHHFFVEREPTIRCLQIFRGGTRSLRTVRRNHLMASFTAVDLSKLEAPALIEELDFETIFAEALAQFRRLMPEFSALIEADPVYKLLVIPPPIS